MPIYAYKCASCGYAKDVLQKLSDAPLTVCPQCGQPSFQKQVTAAGFQLKGTGWYVTDFRGSSSSSTSPDKDGKAESSSDQAKGDAKSDQAKPESKPESKSDASSSGATPAASAPATTPAPSSPGSAVSSD